MIKNIEKFDSVIFDLDGTLIDSFEAINDAFDEVFFQISRADYNLQGI